jgi:hypothetical protein
MNWLAAGQCRNISFPEMTSRGKLPVPIDERTTIVEEILLKEN